MIGPPLEKITMAQGLPQMQHLLRRAGFGASADDLRAVENMSPLSATAYLLNFEQIPDDIDQKIGDSAYAGVTTRGGAFAPNTNIEDARQRWLFRMVHSRRPVQEKMTLFWHNHFATAFSKLNGSVGTVLATKMMALKAGELPGPQGQIEMFRQRGLGKFRDLLVEVAKDPAMIIWLDGQTNTRLRPQENFGREIMELFTFGIGSYTEQDVYAAARVFTGWSVRLVGRRDDPNAYYEFVFNANQHETAAKAFTFPIYANGSTVIPARAAASGMQDGIDFIAALARHPETARRLARKFWNFYVSEMLPPDPGFVRSVAEVYLQADTEIKPVLHYIFQSRQFQNLGNAYSRYSWPVEFVVRAIKEVGWNGLSIDAARTPLSAMGQTLFEPPDVNGWELGEGWFTTGAMLARMNFAATLAFNQRFNLGREAASGRTSPEDVLALFLDRLSPLPYEGEPRNALIEYLNAGGTWTGSDAQLITKASGLTRLIVGSSEYQFM
jgi:uncharacterized protein (DUF1800 family)